MMIGVVATTGKAVKGQFALDSAARLLAWFNDHLGVKYPLPKLDLIAVPGGFGGAMENWGRHHLLREPAAVRPQPIRIAPGAASFPSSRMRWRIIGSAISLPCTGIPDSHSSLDFRA